MTTRIQLSMYVPEPQAAEINAVRRLLDPIQANLIPAHVTLCREDELTSINTASLACRLSDARAKSFTLHFGKPQIFHQHGILLPCIAGDEPFHALRRHVLASTAVRHHAAHITLAHPRNPKSAGNSLASANLLPEMLAIHFTRVALIEQTGAMPWRVLQTCEIHASNQQ
ncbi:MAG: 2'-5' RNA ligase family protein [Polyangiaceae bacterium]|nr:2'-5' RNA ligase family protein [Polyangiaceae bacterium]